jgi:hypothetical protein
MLHCYLLALVVVIASAVPASAQTPWQFRWQKGQVLTYKIKHVTSVTEVVGKEMSASSSDLELVKRWEVTDLDNQGIATLSLTLTAMRNEQKRPNGETLLFDSKDLEKSTPALKEGMSKFVGQTLAVLRIDGFGRVVEVKQGNTARYEAEPPFVVVFPAAKATKGQAWRRQYNLVMEPPLGTGEKHQAEQRYECTDIKGAVATLAVTTSFKTMPESVRERLPLLQKDVQGELQFDLQAGRIVSTAFQIDKTIENHQGKDSSYRFQSKYTEELVGK